jgi:hypothetical protein
MTINYHSVVKLPAITGIPADAVENTFNFIMPGALLLTDMTEISSAIQEFYKTVPVGGTIPVQNYLSPTLSRAAGAASISTYVIPASGPMGAPVDVQSWTLGGGISTTPMPSELAVCLSFNSAYGTDVEFGTGSRPRARDRGRIYLGPLVFDLSTVVNVDATTKRCKVQPQLMNDVTLAAKRLANRTASTWAVWSRKDGTLKEVTRVWVDDAFDIQRRRGEKAITRTTVNV